MPDINKKTRDTYFYLSDEYTLFYLKWIEPEKGALLQGVEGEYWIKRQALPAWKSWSGFAFESLCLKHIGEIKEALKIGGVSTSSGYWKSDANGKKEVEIDLVIDRADQCMNLCEVKFCSHEYILTKTYADAIDKKKALFQEKTRAKKALFTTLITPFGVNENSHVKRVIDHQLTLDALFQRKR